MNNPVAPIEARFWPKVNRTETCWLWTAKLASGYGRFYYGGGHKNPIEKAAHRVAYELLVGPIPDGLELDHLCRNPPCVNPAHLEPVTGRVNKLRGTSPAAIHAKKTHCPKGHSYNEANTRYEKNIRHCRKCDAIYQRKLRAKRREEKM